MWVLVATGAWPTTTGWWPITAGAVRIGAGARSAGAANGACKNGPAIGAAIGAANGAGRNGPAGANKWLAEALETATRASKATM